MRTFKKYLIFNLALIIFHGMMLFTAPLALGGAPDYTPNSEILKGILFFSFIGASPNLLVLLYSVITKKNVKENAIWAAIFFLIVFVAYLITYWPLLK